MPLTILPQAASRQTKIGSLELDATLRETHSHENEVTEHPVERGAAISDHIRPKPDGLVMEGVVSDTPIYVDPEEGRAANAYEALRSIRSAGELVTVVSTLRVYENMAMVSFTVPKDARTGDVTQFSATFKEVRIVDAGSLSFDASKNAGKSKKDKGKQPTKETTASERTKSAIKSGYDWARSP